MRRSIMAVGGAGLLFASAYAASQAPAPTVYEAMKDVIAPQTQVVWDVSNDLMDDDGNPVASRLSDAQWEQIAAASQRIRDMSLALAMADPVRAAAPGVKIDGEGNPEGSTAAQVQGFIDADRATFAEDAKALAASAEALVTAARAKDAARASDVAGTLDQVCEACHQKFWYPQQAAAQ